MTNCKHNWTSPSDYSGMEVRICRKCVAHSFRFTKSGPFNVVTFRYLASRSDEEAIKICKFLFKVVGVCQFNTIENSEAIDYLSAKWLSGRRALMCRLSEVENNAATGYLKLLVKCTELENRLMKAGI